MSASHDFPRQAHNGDQYLPAQEEPTAAATRRTTTLPPSTTEVEEEDSYFLHLSFEDTFGRVLHVFRERYLVFLAITFFIYAAGWVFAVIAAYTLGADLQIDGFSVSPFPVFNMDEVQQGYYDENGDYIYDEASSPQMAEGWQFLLYLLESAIYYCFICIARGASVWLAAHLYLHQRPTMMDAFRRAAKSIWPLIASLLLVECVCVIPVMIVMLVLVYALPQLLVLAVLGILAYMTWLYILFYHTYPAIMVEKLGPVEALTRSYYLTQDRRCYMLGILVCWALVRTAIGMVIGTIKIMGEINSWVWYLGSALDTGCGILFAAIESV
jgi:hypothetical protein